MNEKIESFKKEFEKKYYNLCCTLCSKYNVSGSLSGNYSLYEAPKKELEKVCNAKCNW